MTNQDKLKTLIAEHGLTKQDIADKSGYSVHTLNAYLYPVTSKAHRRLSDRAYMAISRAIDS
jgi:DNA-binding CsgD family transcriptional regulator